MASPKFAPTTPRQTIRLDWTVSKGAVLAGSLLLALFLVSAWGALHDGAYAEAAPAAAAPATALTSAPAPAALTPSATTRTKVFDPVPSTSRGTAPVTALTAAQAAVAAPAAIAAATTTRLTQIVAVTEAKLGLRVARAKSGLPVAAPAKFLTTNVVARPLSALPATTSTAPVSRAAVDAAAGPVVNQCNPPAFPTGAGSKFTATPPS